MKGHFTSETFYCATLTEWVSGCSKELVGTFWRTEKSLDPQGLTDLAKYSSTLEKDSN
jgi:hypothetical protein